MAKTRTLESQTAPPADQRASDQQAQGTAKNPSDEQSRIERRAYELYLKRGGSHGQDWDDWLAAEREVRGSRTERSR